MHCVYPGKKGIHSNLGHLLWSLQSMEGISIGNDKMSAFPHYRMMLIPSIDCKLHKRCPRFEWIPFFPGYTQCKPYEGFNMYIAGEIWQNLKQFFKRMHDNRTMRERELCYIINPIKLYTPLLCITKIWFSFMNVVKSYLKMKNSKFFLTPSIYMCIV